MPDLYGVMGHPVSHSKSPIIYGIFARQTGQDMEYHAIHVLPGDFERAVTDFRARSGKGLNVTLPFKEQAWGIAGNRTSRAERAGAVNTLWFGTDGCIHGGNTDGGGLVRDLRLNQGFQLENRRILLLGAGGAARGVLGSLLDEKPHSLIIANRTIPKAATLAGIFSDSGDISARGFAELEGERFDLILNATSASMEGKVPPLPPGVLKPGGICYDMMYAYQPTAFVSWGREQDAAESIDGLGMLVEQAAESFYLWRGVRPDTGQIIKDLRSNR